MTRLVQHPGSSKPDKWKKHNQEGRKYNEKGRNHNEEVGRSVGDNS